MASAWSLVHPRPVPTNATPTSTSPTTSTVVLNPDCGKPEARPKTFDWRAARAANDFAAELLMPRRFISAAHAGNSDPALLAERFEVSQLAMGYRLVSLGLRK
jgi:hypothetical protein